MTPGDQQEPQPGQIQPCAGQGLTVMGQVAVVAVVAVVVAAGWHW